MIPTSKIYEILLKLLEKGIILDLFEGNKKKYIPLNLDEFIEKYLSKTKNMLDELSVDLNHLKKNDDVSYIWNIKDYKYLIEKAKKLINEAQETVLISIWDDEMKSLNKEIKKSINRNIKISIIHYGDTQLNYGRVFHHPIENTIYSEKGGRFLAIVKDSCEALIGTIYENNQTDGAYSKNRGFVMSAEDYLKHDIYIMKIVERFDKELIAKFGENYRLLRDVYNDEELI